jgi:hypothetical protein
MIKLSPEDLKHVAQVLEFCVTSDAKLVQLESITQNLVLSSGRRVPLKVVHKIAEALGYVVVPDRRRQARSTRGRYYLIRRARPIELSPKFVGYTRVLEKWLRENLVPGITYDRREVYDAFRRAYPETRNLSAHSITRHIKSKQFELFMTTKNGKSISAIRYWSSEGRPKIFEPCLQRFEPRTPSPEL